jgi:hypothetical protein
VRDHIIGVSVKIEQKLNMEDRIKTSKEDESGII